MSFLRVVRSSQAAVKTDFSCGRVGFCGDGNEPMTGSLVYRKAVFDVPVPTGHRLGQSRFPNLLWSQPLRVLSSRYLGQSGTLLKHEAGIGVAVRDILCLKNGACFHGGVGK